MKRFLFFGVAVVLSVNFVLAGGTAPKKEDIPKYVKTLESTSAKAGDKRTAADMIAKRGQINAKDVEDAITPLQKLAQKDKDAGVRKSAIHALGSIAPDDKETIPLLVKILKSDSAQDVKFESVYALARFGPRAKDALPAIRDFAKGLDKKQAKSVKAAHAAISGQTK